MSEYVWDYRNRLTNVRQRNSSGGAVVQEQIYRYDPMDRRIGVGSDPDGAGSQPATWQWTVYDGQNPYADFDNSGSLTNRYVSGDAVDQLFARFSASGTAAWYLTDQMGSVRDIANTSGSVIDHIKYDSFGKLVSESSPSNGDRFKFTGREYDSTTKQYNYLARYYDAAIGRFTSEDPTGFSSGDTNTYRYVGNSPTFMVDPTGQAAIPAFDRANGPYMENPVYREWLANQSQSTGGGGDGGEGGGGGGGGVNANDEGSTWVWPWVPNASWYPDDTLSQWTGIPAAMFPHGGGVLIAETIEVGAGLLGCGEQGAAGWGLYTGGSHFGGFADWGGFIPGPCNGPNSFVYPNPNTIPCSSGEYGVIGLGASVGPGIFVTNASQYTDLAGPFMNFNLNTPVGAIQGAYDGVGIWTLTITGPSPILSVSSYPTNTVVFGP